CNHQASLAVVRAADNDRTASWLGISRMASRRELMASVKQVTLLSTRTSRNKDTAIGKPTLAIILSKSSIFRSPLQIIRRGRSPAMVEISIYTRVRSAVLVVTTWALTLPVILPPGLVKMFLATTLSIQADT